MGYEIPEAYKDKTRQYVALISLKHGDRFYTMNHEDPERLNDGTVAYAILGYFGDSKEFTNVAYCDAAQEFYYDTIYRVLS